MKIKKSKLKQTKTEKEARSLHKLILRSLISENDIPELIKYGLRQETADFYYKHFGKI